MQTEIQVQIAAMLREYPLYRKFYNDLLNKANSEVNTFPSKVWYDCFQCKSTTVHQRRTIPLGNAPDVHNLKTLISLDYAFGYYCSGCETLIRFFIEVNTEEHWLRKVGQIPPWNKDIPKDVRKEIGKESSDLYSKALFCLSMSYGIAACAYLRRIIENEITPILNLLYEIKQEEGASTKDLDAIKAAIESKDFTSKTKFAAEIAPNWLLTGGLNPFKIIHDTLSYGVHHLDEETAVYYAHAISTSLVYVIRQLKKHQEEKRQYFIEMQRINNLKTG